MPRVQMIAARVGEVPGPQGVLGKVPAPGGGSWEGGHGVVCLGDNQHQELRPWGPEEQLPC